MWVLHSKVNADLMQACKKSAYVTRENCGPKRSNCDILINIIKKKNHEYIVHSKINNMHLENI